MANCIDHQRHQNTSTVLQQLTINHISREANKAANWILKVVHLIQSSFSVDNCNSSALQKIIVKDALGIFLESLITFFFSLPY